MTAITSPRQHHAGSNNSSSFSCPPGRPPRALVWKRSFATLTTLVAVWPHPAVGQFRTPLHRAFPDTAVARYNDTRTAYDTLRSTLHRSAKGDCRGRFLSDPDRQRACIKNLNPTRLADSVLADSLRHSTCAKRPPSSKQSCELEFDADEEVRRAKSLNYPLVLMPHSQRDMRELYDRRLSILPRLSTALSRTDVLVQTDVISGYVGVVGFGVSQVSVVSATDSTEVLGRDTVRGVTEDVLSLVHNGGTMTLTVQYLVYAGGGANLQQSVSVYAQGGLLGPLGSPDSVRFSGAIVGEFTRMMSIRAPNATATLLGEVFVGVRIGTAFVENPIWAGVNDDRVVPFGQLGLGLRQHGSFTLSALYSYLPPGIASHDFMPRLMLSVGLAR